MSIGNKLGIVALAAALGGLIVPALAENGTGAMQSGPDQGMSMDHMGHEMMGGMMGGGMMSRRMMARGCSGMMQSMNNGGNGRPNSQWRRSSPGNPSNGG